MMSSTLYPLVDTHSPTRQQANSRAPLRSGLSNGDVAGNVLSSSYGDTSLKAFSRTDHPRSSNEPLQIGLEEKRYKNMARRKSAGLPTHLNLQGSGYGYRTPAMQDVRFQDHNVGDPRFQLRDALNIILIPLPFCLAWQLQQAVLSTAAAQDKTKPQSFPSGILAMDGIPSITLSMWLVSTVTASTLALLGIGAIVAQGLGLLRRSQKRGEATNLRQMTLGGLVQAALLRYMVVGLPLFSICCIGGLRVIVVVLSAMAADVSSIGGPVSKLARWINLLQHRRWLLAALSLQLIADLSGVSGKISSTNILLGYGTLAAWAFALPMAYSSQSSHVSKLTLGRQAGHSEGAPDSRATSHQRDGIIGACPLIASVEDSYFTLLTAGCLAVLVTAVSFTMNLSAGAQIGQHIGWIGLTALSFSISLAFSDIRALQKAKSLGSLAGSVGSFLFEIFTTSDVNQWRVSSMAIFILICYAAVFVDTYSSSAAANITATSLEKSKHHTDPQPSEIHDASWITKLILPQVRAWPLLHTIIRDKDSRRIFYFMCLNFAFMIVQTFYGIVSGSLGLLSDSIHMFFDCLALIVGLCAAVMSRWPPSARFPYGYAKIETLAGFANGIFLMLISVEIIYEAIERLSEGTDVKRLNELMTVSIMGLVINLVGILAFGHAHHGHDHSHGHSHSHGHPHHHEGNQKEAHVHDNGGQSHHHSHQHDHEDTPNRSHHADHHADHRHEGPDVHTERIHSNGLHHHDENIRRDSAGDFAQANGDFLIVPSPISSVYNSVPATPSKPCHTSPNAGHKAQESSHVHDHSHSHGHSHHHHDHGGHHHHHHSENMMGIYLHILGDTLGSLAVVVSTWLVQWNGWSGWDPVASTGIAIIIFGTAIPLVKNCARKLLLTVPEDTEYDLREALAGVGGLRGVAGCTVPKFWIQDGDHRQIMGVVHVVAEKTSNLEDVKERSLAFLSKAGLDVLVQVEREGATRCWCQATR